MAIDETVCWTRSFACRPLNPYGTFNFTIALSFPEIGESPPMLLPTNDDIIGRGEHRSLLRCVCVNPVKTSPPLPLSFKLDGPDLYG